MAEKYHSETFQPHLTLAGVPDWPEKRLIQEMKKIAGSASPVELSLSNVRCKHLPYQKLTVEVEKSEALGVFHQQVDTIFEGSYSKTTYPHFSLLYSNLECESLNQTVSEIEENIPQRVVVDRIALIYCKGTPGDWRTLYKGKLNKAEL